MTIIGIVAAGNKKEILDIVQDECNIKLSLNRIGEWIEYDAGVYDENTIVVFSRNNSTLVYFDSDFLFEDFDFIFKDILKKVPKGCGFFGNETSMSFGMIFGDGYKIIADDYYLFENGFKHNGPNYLHLGKDNDIISDGFFPTIYSYVGQMKTDEKVEIYSYSKIKQNKQELKIKDKSDKKWWQFWR